jgi:glycosyltransferase involved in cell wall biosynthesis
MIKELNVKGILFVGYFLSDFSYGRCVCEDLSEHFREYGFQVVTTSRITNRYLRILDMVATIIRRRNDYQVASVEVYNGWAFLWAEITCLFLRLLKKPFVITLHGARMLQFAQRWPLRVRRLLQQADLVTTPSKLFQNKFSSWRSDIIYLPNAIDISIYPNRLRNNPSPTLGWLRKFEKNYNPVLAVKTLALLKKDFPKIKLVMSGADFGDGSSEEVNRFVQANKLNDYLDITGFVSRSQISEWFSQSDIYINTTTVESFGIAVMEAAAAGLCIVTTDVGELSHLWKDNEEALLVPTNDPEAMATAIRRILTEPDLAARLSINARAKAENYDWLTVLPQWEKVFERLGNNV